MAKEKGMDRKEKSACDFIELAFEPHKGKWMENAKRLNEWFNGRYNNTKEGIKNIDKFTVNSIFSLINLLIPNFIFQQPHIKVRPRSAAYYKEMSTGQRIQIDNNKAAFIREAALNHTYKLINAIEEDRKATQDAFFYGFGITKTGYSYDTIMSDDKDYILKDQYFHKRVNPKDFGWHPMASDLSDSIKLVHRVMMTKTQLKKRYKDAKLTEIDSDVPQHMKDKLKGKWKDAYKDYVTLYEVHDQENDMVLTFAGENHMLVDKHERIYGFNGSDFDMIKFSGENDEFQGIPFMLMIEDEAKALNELFTLLVQHARKFPGQIFHNHGAIDEDDKERIVNGEQGSVHGVNDISQIRREPPLQMGPEYFNIIQLLQNQMEKTLGIPDFTRMSGSNRKSATEASYIQGDATVRRAYYLEIVKSFVLSGAQKVAALQAQFQDAEEEFMTSGEMGYQMVRYDKTDIQGDYQFDFDIDNLAYINEAEFNQINNLFNVLGAHQILHPILNKIDPVKAGKQLFKRVNMNMESLMSGSVEETIVYDPERENELAAKGELMPRPKKGEHHEWHLQIHRQYVEQRIKAVGPEQAQQMPEIQQIIEHMAETQMLMDGGPAVPNSPPAGQVQAPQQGPQGPMQQPETPQASQPPPATLQ